MDITPWNGKPISKPGWYSDIPIERYHAPNMCAGPSVSSSNLRTCWSQSAAHMYDAWAENPDAEQDAPTRSQIIGAAAHHLLLGEDKFDTKFVARPETYNDTKTGIEKAWNNNAHACQDWNDKQAKTGRVVVTVKELQSIVAMSESLALEPLVQEGLLRGDVETSGFFKDKQTNLWVKVRPDVIPRSGSDFVDLKTASEVTSVALMSALRSYGYHQQGALIWEACEVLGQPFTSFMLVFVETKRPFCARTSPLTDEDLALGRRQNEAMRRKIRRCMDADHWPGPGDGDTRPLPLPNDERTRINERLKFEGVS